MRRISVPRACHFHWQVPAWPRAGSRDGAPGKGRRRRSGRSPPSRRLLNARVSAFLAHLKEAFPEGTPEELATYLSA